MMKRILVLNGPNLDMLGTREPAIYGDGTLASLEALVVSYGQRVGVEITCYQSNSEAKLINQIHRANGAFDGIVYNPGAHTHYSYALRDAIASIELPVVEVHISDVSAREAFRRISVIAPVCAARVKGLGFGGYLRGIDVLVGTGQFVRLGEDYAHTYGEDAAVIVGGVPAAPQLAASQSAAPQPAAPQLAASQSAAPQPVAPAPFVASQPPVLSSEDTRALAVERLSRVRAACAQLGIGALLVRDTPNIHWLTALDGVFDEERAHALLVAANNALLHTDSRYRNACATALATTQVDVTLADATGDAIQFAADALKRPGQEPFSALLGIEDTITYAEFVKMVEAFGTEQLAPTHDVVLGLRAVKSPSEVARLRAAQAITDAAFAHICSVIKPGMTEREVQLELDFFMLRHGAEGLAFSTIVACGENAADPHAIVSDKRLEAGQCVVMDFGARASGYCSDMTRTVFLGQPSSEMSMAWNALRQANEQVEAMLRPGVTGAQAHELALRVLAEGGFANTMGHGLGHGVGLEVHELPVLSPRNAAPLEPGNVVTVEPGIYIPGKFGMRLEDFGVVTEAGFDIFTRSPHDLIVL